MTYPPVPLAILLAAIILETQVIRHLPSRYKNGMLGAVQTALAIVWPLFTLFLAGHAAWFGVGTRLLSIPTLIVSVFLLVFIATMIHKFLVSRDYTQEDVQRLEGIQRNVDAGQPRKRLTPMTIIMDFLPLTFVLNLLVQSVLTQYLAR